MQDSLIQVPCNSKKPKAKCNYVRNSLTGTVRSLFDRWIQGTRDPPTLATKSILSRGSISPVVTVDEGRP